MNRIVILTVLSKTQVARFCGRRQSVPAVILTKVRIQGHGRPTSWLWILTFVRMTVVVRMAEWE
ncbi:hypothetical protein ASG20_03655 [Sphingomonas sp. Leaf198]|nr:hypothetical protein ASG20_03655 [Sphingomonas sp. Leaf198]